jgi:hypothetical protein
MFPTECQLSAFLLIALLEVVLNNDEVPKHLINQISILAR